ncbi:ATP-binding protein [Streptomyces sp. NPDC093085]|uniref:ATP-binding protein n=1 Tax=Streptomyces sp. NPDC093085 TaxID=3155068 RepID=UPI00342D012A
MVTTLPLPPAPPQPHGGESYRLLLPNTAGAPKIARDFVASLLAVSRHLPLVDDARLCVTEIVTNVHRHTGTDLIRVQATVSRELITVFVSDDNPWALPVPGVPGASGAPGAGSGAGSGHEPEAGQGLLLVTRLAVAWGATLYGGCAPTHKAVWFTLARSADADADAGAGA